MSMSAQPSGESLLTRGRWTAYAVLHAVREGRFPFARPSAIERAQRRRVRTAVTHAYEHVPYYRETMRALGLSPADFRTAADLGALPIIEREQLQRNPEYFLSEARPIDSYLKLRSAGSTGDLLTVFTDPFSLFQDAGHRERQRSLVMKLAGKRFRCRQVRIIGPSSTGAKTRRAFASHSLVPASVRVAQRELSMLDPLNINIDLINELRPDVLFGWGSYIEALFLHVHASGTPLHRPKVVTYGGDPLSESVRRLITEEFGVHVLGSYGAVEAFNIAFECEEHRGLHMNVDLFPLRIVDAEGRELPDGESGRVVVSNLVNRATVLLNYSLGDLAKRLPRSCPCGRSLPMLSFLEGRRDDWIETDSGELVHPEVLRMLFRDEEQIWSYQVIQRTTHHFQIAVVAHQACDREAMRSRLTRKFVDRFGDRTTAELSFVDTLRREPGKKVRPVISLRSERKAPAPDTR
jgi:phenylacetate-CoA ligase